MGSLTLAEPFSIFPLPAYKVSKAALNALTIQWALALSSEGFVVTSINPGVSFSISFCRRGLTGIYSLLKLPWAVEMGGTSLLNRAQEGFWRRL
jgi:NAD(P)-dependent dehydrogenase (short-subunit alcohol dehydrogenase family)